MLENFRSRRSWLAWGLVKGLTPAKRRTLQETYGDPEEIFSWAHSSSVKTADSRDEVLRQRIAAVTTEVVDRELRLLENAGAEWITFVDELYPAALRQIVDGPPFLAVCGQKWREVLQLLEAGMALTVVGARRATSYGRSVARHLLQPLARNGIMTVSGGAYGIDAIVHETSLEAGGLTVAVLGSGFGRLYPPSHRGLFQAIAKQGALLSEFPMETAPHAGNFPQRNRLLAALTRGTLVVEADRRSGSLITARMALDLGREVMAVPGPIHSPLSRGSHDLIAQGAQLIASSRDLSAVFSWELDLDDELAESYSANESKVLGLLESEALTYELLYSRSAFSIADLSRTLIGLKSRGLVEDAAGGRVMRTIKGMSTWPRH